LQVNLNLASVQTTNSSVITVPASSLVRQGPARSLDQLQRCSSQAWAWLGDSRTEA
jgi:hypothetical protein